MIKLFITDAVISKGYEGAPALKFSENNGATTGVQFKIGHRVYDSRVEGNHRFINLAVKAFGPVCARVEKMKLKEGSHVHIVGRLDEETWEDQGQKRSRIVAIVEDIEYAPIGGGKSNGTSGVNGTASAPAAQNGQGAVPPQSAPPPQQLQGGQTGMQPNFTGYDSFGGDNPFFPGT